MSLVAEAKRKSRKIRNRNLINQQIILQGKNYLRVKNRSVVVLEFSPAAFLRYGGKNEKLDISQLFSFFLILFYFYLNIIYCKQAYLLSKKLIFSKEGRRGGGKKNDLSRKYTPLSLEKSGKELMTPAKEQ